MVALTAPLPNVRKLFIPDPGYYIADCDLSGADAQVVAWEAEDEDLKAAFRAGLKIHIKNARDCFPEKVRGWSDEAIKATNYSGGLYDSCKKGVHATNYVGSARTIAIRLGWTVHEAERFQRNWFGLHPGILRWHERVAQQLERDRTVTNKFGYRRTFFDRPERLLPEAVAWTPQSTVAIVAFRGGLQVKRQLPWVQLLLQVHDNQVMQYPLRYHNERYRIRDALTVTVPYDDPLTIPWGLAVSRRSWGDGVATAWE